MSIIFDTCAQVADANSKLKCFEDTFYIVPLLLVNELILSSIPAFLRQYLGQNWMYHYNMHKTNPYLNGGNVKQERKRERGRKCEFDIAQINASIIFSSLPQWCAERRWHTWEKFENNLNSLFAWTNVIYQNINSFLKSFDEWVF